MTNTGCVQVGLQSNFSLRSKEDKNFSGSLGPKAESVITVGFAEIFVVYWEGLCMHFHRLRCGPQEKEKQKGLQRYTDGYKKLSSEKLQVSELGPRMEDQLTP